MPKSEHRLESFGLVSGQQNFGHRDDVRFDALNVATHEKRVVAKRSKQPFRGLFYTSDGKKLISVYDGIHVMNPKRSKHLLTRAIITATRP